MSKSPTQSGWCKQIIRNKVDFATGVCWRSRASTFGSACRARAAVASPLYREMFDKVKAGIQKEPRNVDDYLEMLSISRHLERIADHATNIAEDVIYMIEGAIIRHSGGKFKS